MNVYIDGACSNNGKPNAKSGYGVYFSENDSRNEYGQVDGKQSNNTGELTAFIRSLEILEKDISNSTKINVYTDSEYVMKCATTYGAKLEANDWKNSENKIPPNVALVKKARMLYKNAKCVKLHYIEAHTNKDDIHSIGNSHADRLACLAIGSMPHEEESVVRLDWITFGSKDLAKELGAKWNIKGKYWYADKNVSEKNMKGLIELKQFQGKTPAKNTDNVDGKKIYIKVDFAKKDKAKSLGAKWDPSAKSWYYIESTISEGKVKEMLKL